MTFICRNGLVHHKPVNEDREPSSNNGFIYSAIFANQGGEIDIQKIKETYEACKVELSSSNIIIYRLPGKGSPPMSMDEIIGLVSLGLLTAEELEANNWYFHGSGEEMDKIWWTSTLWHGFKIRNKHRNYFWENEVIPVYKMAYKVPPFHRYYIKKMAGIEPTRWESITFGLNAGHIRTNGSAGENNILALQIEDMNKKDLNEYFVEDHPVQRLL